MAHERRVVPFRAWHYRWLVSGSTDGLAMPNLDEATLAQMEKENSWVGIVNGDPIACAGTVGQWKGRHIAWAYMTKATGPHMRWITREVSKRLGALQGRVEFTVKSDFAAGHKWARLLGFEVESPLMKMYGPLGEDHVGYVRINNA